MSTLAFSLGKLSRKDLILGIVGSLVVHMGLLYAAAVLSQVRTSPLDNIPFYTVNLVSSEDIKMGSPVPQNEAPDKKVAESAPPAQEAPPPETQVKKLQLEGPSAEAELKRVSPGETPKISERPSPAIEKSLEKLIPKPQPKPQPSPPPAAAPQAPQTSAGSAQEAAPPRNQASASPQKDVRNGNGTGQGANRQEGRELNLLRRLYYGEVWNAIRSQWILPKALMNAKDLEATLIVLIRRDGKILSHRFERRSGNGLFDESVLRAVLKADPLPPFPQAYSPSQEEIGVRFRPEDLN